MTDEEIEVIAEELARTSGVPWCPEHEQDGLLNVVTNRYRDRARAAIAALDRFRIQESSFVKDPVKGNTLSTDGDPQPPRGLQPGATVVYRPPGDRRAYPCRIMGIQGDRVCLAPILRARAGWISLESLAASMAATGPGGEQEPTGGGTFD